MEINEVGREDIEDFLQREWKPVNEGMFGLHDPTMWDIRRRSAAVRGVTKSVSRPTGTRRRSVSIRSKGTWWRAS